MQPREAVLMVLRDEREPLHWTKIQDLALRRGLIDPFEIRDVRRAVLGALGDATRDGAIVRRGKGVYAVPGEDDAPKEEDGAPKEEDGAPKDEDGAP